METNQRQAIDRLIEAGDGPIESEEGHADWFSQDDKAFYAAAANARDAIKAMRARMAALEAVVEEVEMEYDHGDAFREEVVRCPICNARLEGSGIQWDATDYGIQHNKSCALASLRELEAKGEN